MLEDSVTGRVVPLTETGRFHIALLRLNRPTLVDGERRDEDRVSIAIGHDQDGIGTVRGGYVLRALPLFDTPGEPWTRSSTT